MECKFCKGTPKRAEYVGDGYQTIGMMIEMLFGSNEDAHSNYIYIKDDNLLVWDNSAGEYAELSAEIKYCPMCGRKLQSNTTEPQTEETEMERLERIDNELEDAWARIRELTDEPQTEKPKIRKRNDKPFRAVWLDDDHNEIGTPQTERSNE